MEGKNEKGKGKNPINFFKGKKVNRKKGKKRADAVGREKRTGKRKKSNKLS